MNDENLVVQVRIRLDPGQAARLDSRARERGCTRSEYIRKALEVQMTAEEDLQRTLMERPEGT